jgi:hypothetical protein
MFFAHCLIGGVLQDEDGPGNNSASLSEGSLLKKALLYSSHRAVPEHVLAPTRVRVWGHSP